MKKEELWEIYLKKNPSFGEAVATVTLTSAGIRKLFEQTWDQAHTQGVANGRAAQQLEDKCKQHIDRSGVHGGESIFKQMFG